MNELILIVEDDDDIAQVLRYNLRKAGYRTVIAADGKQALRNVQCGEPDLMLLDVMLPAPDGWEVCRIVRNSEQGATLPIIMLSALSGEDQRIKGLRMGADDFVAKPFSVTELLFKVRKLLDKSMVISALRNRSEDHRESMRSLTHELRNSLTIVGGYAFLAASRKGSEPWVRHVASAADRMEQALNEAASLTDPRKRAAGPQQE